MSDPASNETIVRDFCAAFARRDIDDILGFFADDAVYHNIPLAPARGHDEIRAILQSFVPASPAIEFEMLHVACADAFVHTERIDRMTFNGKAIELPVAGVFEVRDGKIHAWRDYFDMQQLLS